VVRHLLAGRVLVAVDGDGFHAQALQRDQHFLAELAGAQQHDFGGGRGEGRSRVVMGRLGQGKKNAIVAPGRPDRRPQNARRSLGWADGRRQTADGGATSGRSGQKTGNASMPGAIIRPIRRFSTRSSRSG
jgi:hypothetical protein